MSATLAAAAHSRNARAWCLAAAELRLGAAHLFVGAFGRRHTAKPAINRPAFLLHLEVPVRQERQRQLAAICVRRNEDRDVVLDLRFTRGAALIAGATMFISTFSLPRATERILISLFPSR